MIIPTAISGAWSHYRRGNVDVEVALLLTPGALLGGCWGPGWRRDPRRPAAGIFGLLLLYFALRYLGVEDWLRARLARLARLARSAASVEEPEGEPEGNVLGAWPSIGAQPAAGVVAARGTEPGPPTPCPPRLMTPWRRPQ